jgi:hypothetical protein
MFKELTSKVNPLALGNVQRVYAQIRWLASRLLELGTKPGLKPQKIEEIVKALTIGFYSHSHAITKKQAIELFGGWVRTPNEGEAPLLWTVFNTYAGALELRNKFNLPEYMEDTQIRALRTIGGFIESGEMSYAFVTETKIAQRPNLPPNVQVQVPPGAPIPLAPWVSRAYDFGIVKQGWVRNEGEI